MTTCTEFTHTTRTRDGRPMALVVTLDPRDGTVSWARYIGHDCDCADDGDCALDEALATIPLESKSERSQLSTFVHAHMCSLCGIRVARETSACGDQVCTSCGHAERMRLTLARQLTLDTYSRRLAAVRGAA